MRAEIDVRYESRKEAEAVAKAISPDNIVVPLGLSVKTVVKDNSLVTSIECRKSLKTFISTIDDVLQAIQTAERTLRVAKKHG